MKMTDGASIAIYGRHPLVVKYMEESMFASNRASSPADFSSYASILWDRFCTKGLHLHFIKRQMRSARLTSGIGVRWRRRL